MRKALHETVGDRFGNHGEHDRDNARILAQRHQRAGGMGDNHIRLQTDEFNRSYPRLIGGSGVPARVNPNVTALCPSQIA